MEITKNSVYMTIKEFGELPNQKIDLIYEKIGRHTHLNWMYIHSKGTLSERLVPIYIVNCWI